MTRLTRSPIGLAAMVAVVVIGSLAAITLVIAVLPSTVFELEGNIAPDDDGNPATDDWLNNNCANPDASTADSKTFAPDPVGETIFKGGGSKDFADIPDWLHKSGSVPSKDEITNAYAAKYGSVLVLGGERQSIDGAAQIGAWFFQEGITTNGVDQMGGTTFTGEHKNGDLLILAEFTIGGTASDILVFEWVGSPGDCPGGVPCPAATDNAGTLADITASATDAEGFSNSVSLTIPGTCPEWQYEDNHGNTQVIGPNGFFEVGIDLAQLGLDNICFASFLLETRSSHSVDAVLKDFVLGGFEACEVACEKSVTPDVICEGEEATYTITADNPGGADLEVTIVDDIYGNVCLPTTDGDPCILQDAPCPSSMVVEGNSSRSCTITDSPAAGTIVNNVTVSGTVVGGTGGPDPAVCTETLIVNPNPVVMIDHIDACLFESSFMLCATPSGGTEPFSFLWSTGEMTQCITNTATGAYSVTATDTNGCFANDLRNVGYCSD